MADNPIPMHVRRQLWDLLREYADVKAIKVPILGGLTVRWFLHRIAGYDRGPSQ